jgi:curved DNA-binding protein CbpA
MPIKDLYGILEIESSATMQEIKKAYRRLAQQFHPDKNDGDPYAHARFAEIKKAYEVLTHPAKKEQYLQQRWYDQSIGTKRKQVTITPVNILKQVLELERYVSKLDVFRMDKQGLHDHIASLLDNEAVEKLNSFHEESTNDQLILILINCLKVLPLDMVLSLQHQLNKIETSSAVQEKLDHFVAARQRSNQREKYRIWMIIIAVIILCTIILFSA